MRFATLASTAAERVTLPDSLTRIGIATLVDRTSRSLAVSDPEVTRAFADAMRPLPIAACVEDANAQHYEVPAAFFELVLGPQRKYSCCLFRRPNDTLAEAEEAALEETCARAGICNGQDILELGCGWGSLSLWMARTFSDARITAVSNSHSQRAFIEAEAKRLGLSNLTVITADMNKFNAEGAYDRIVSIEMFEHMANWRALLARVRLWLRPEGRAFVHVFAHRTTPYRFDHNNPADWIAKHFFTGGLMPSRALMYEFGDLFEVEADWWWQGTHYARTADAWLANFDRNREGVRKSLLPVYGDATALWMRRWRLFFLATSGLFGAHGGNEWGVAHYLLLPRSI
jgi:cyclopropane-fatty-acyl-phospholipid synthase